MGIMDIIAKMSPNLAPLPIPLALTKVRDPNTTPPQINENMVELIPANSGISP